MRRRLAISRVTRQLGLQLALLMVQLDPKVTQLTHSNCDVHTAVTVARLNARKCVSERALHFHWTVYDSYTTVWWSSIAWLSSYASGQTDRQTIYIMWRVCVFICLKHQTYSSQYFPPVLFCKTSLGWYQSHTHSSSIKLITIAASIRASLSGLLAASESRSLPLNQYIWKSAY